MTLFRQQMINNPLLFYTKNDIPFEEAKLIIHTPTINELGLISEESYRIATQVISEAGKILRSQDNSDLINKDDFDIFIAIMNNKEEDNEVPTREHVLKFFNILFPDYKIRVREIDIQLMENKENGLSGFIDKTNFSSFQEIIKKMFLIEQGNGKEYNPADGMAAKIAEKLQKARQKKASQKEDGQKSISVYKRYASILSIGLQMDVNILLNYSVSQLEEAFQRFILLTKWDINLKARLAGATDLEDAEDWMQEI